MQIRNKGERGGCDATKVQSHNWKSLPLSGMQFKSIRPQGHIGLCVLNMLNQLEILLKSNTANSTMQYNNHLNINMLHKTHIKNVFPIEVNVLPILFFFNRLWHQISEISLMASVFSHTMAKSIFLILKYTMLLLRQVKHVSHTF